MRMNDLALQNDLFEQQMRERPQDTLLNLLHEHCMSLAVVRERMYQSDGRKGGKDGERFSLSIYCTQTSTLRYWILETKDDQAPANLLFNDIPIDPSRKRDLVNNVSLTLCQLLDLPKLIRQNLEARSAGLSNRRSAVALSATRLHRTGYLEQASAVDLTTFLTHFEVLDHWVFHA